MRFPRYDYQRGVTTARMRKRAKRAGKRARAGIVIFVTSDKIIQAVLTSAATAVVLSFNEGIAAYIQRLLAGYVPVYVPVKLYAAGGAALIFMAAFWADRHTEEWRAWVRDTTGEETAEDTASEEDVAGEKK